MYPQSHPQRMAFVFLYIPRAFGAKPVKRRPGGAGISYQQPALLVTVLDFSHQLFLLVVAQLLLF